MPARKKRKTVGERFEDMTLKNKLILLGSISAALIAIGGAMSLASNKIDQYRPWAIRETEMVVAGFQLDRFSSDARDIDARILRLEQKQKFYSRQWTQEDQAELNYWRNEKMKIQQRIDMIRQQQRPMYLR